MRTFACCRAPRGATWALLAALAACNTSGDEMAWARAALERNDRLEIIAEDSDARTFTVRVRDSGELRVVRVDEISATVVDAGATPPGKTASAASPTDAPTQTAPESAGATPGEPAGATRPEAVSGEAAQMPDTPREPVAATGTGRVIAAGPGYSIQAGEKGAAPANRAADASAGAAVERRTEPLVCQGSRFLRIDGRNIAFEGDALVAEEGCELFITNSRITANGLGLAARGASVHIKNSTVAGQSGAIHASGNAQIYAQSSRFSGMVRRLDEAVLHDMGDNIWN